MVRVKYTGSKQFVNVMDPTIEPAIFEINDVIMCTVPDCGQLHNSSMISSDSCILETYIWSEGRRSKPWNFRRRVSSLCLAAAWCRRLLFSAVNQV